jgi:CTP synthase
VIKKERRGEYLGAHGAGDPAHHRRDQGVHRSAAPARPSDVGAIVEVGGTVGDIESLPFLEAIRQMGLELGATTPASSTSTLRAVHRRRPASSRPSPPSTRSRSCARSASSPTSLLCRADRPHPRRRARQDRAVLATSPRDAVISVLGCRHASTRCRRMLHDAGARRDRLRRSSASLRRAADLSRVERAWCDALEHPARRRSRIAMVGKYVDLDRLLQVAQRGAASTPASTPRARVSIDYIDSEAHRARRGDRRRSAGVDAILVPGGFGERGIEGKIARHPPSRASTGSPTSASAWACSWP